LLNILWKRKFAGHFMQNAGRGIWRKFSGLSRERRDGLSPYTTYSGRNQTARFAYVTLLRLEGKQKTYRCRYLPLGNNVYGMHSTYFLTCYPLPLLWSPCRLPLTDVEFTVPFRPLYIHTCTRISVAVIYDQWRMLRFGWQCAAKPQLEEYKRNVLLLLVAVVVVVVVVVYLTTLFQHLRLYSVDF
jgi:hypothetical protein